MQKSARIIIYPGCARDKILAARIQQETGRIAVFDGRSKYPVLITPAELNRRLDQSAPAATYAAQPLGGRHA